jgi:ketosteroid isomerase-like protein
MKTTLCLFACLFSVSCERTGDDFKPETIIGLERAALDRWFNGDPQGYLETYASEVTYFDPVQEKRVDGVEAMRTYLTPITGKIKGARYDMMGARVQHHGDVAILSYNLFSYGKRPDGTERLAARWNSTKVYGRVGGNWKIVHDHWSFIKPDLKPPPSE